MTQLKTIWRIRMTAIGCNDCAYFCVSEAPTNTVLYKAITAYGGGVELLDLCQVNLQLAWENCLYDGPLGFIESEPVRYYEVV